VRLLLVRLILCSAPVAMAQTTNALSDAEIQGRQLAQQLCDGWPDASTKTGVLQIRDPQRKSSEIPLKCAVMVTATNWRSFYGAKPTNQTVALWVIHAPGQANEYFYHTNSPGEIPVLGDIPVLGHLFRSHQVSGAELMTPFAGSDFWITDLGLEFFHWPAQKILKKEVKRSRGCTVLESTNPEPSPGGYSRVVSWIDSETLGIVQAEAYDTNGKLLKEFYPKDFKKVKGQWQVGSMDIDNVQTGSRTRMEFDLQNE